MRFAVTVGWVLLVALAPHRALAEETRVPAIWYRASESCPTGPSFLGKLAENGHLVRLAQGGDHIDFVVTLLAAETGTVGRLERQTNGGTVAIRELRDATCERVADALALSLGLAVDPSALAREPTSLPAESEPATPPATPAPSVAQAPPPSPLRAPMAVPSPSVVPKPPLRTRQWSIGLSLGAIYGLATHPLPQGAAFVSLDRVGAALLPELSLRLGVVGASGSFDTPLGSVQRSLFSAHVEACPVRLGSEQLAVRLCAVSELGVTRVTQDEPVTASATALWWAPGTALRGELGLSRRVRLEVTVSGLQPVPRHEVSAAGAQLYRDAIVTVSGALGVSFLLP